MAYEPSAFSSSTIWLEGFSFVFCCCLGGTWTSNALRDIGCVIMKMISSTSSTSISGVTLMSALSAELALVVVTDRANGLGCLLRLDCLGEVIGRATCRQSWHTMSIACFS